MLEAVRVWIFGVAAAALLAAVAEALLQGAGPVRRAGRFVCALVLILAVVRPLTGLRPEALARSLADYRAAAGAYDTALEDTNDALLKSIIEAESAAYIEKNADALGMTCSVRVSCAEGETPFPVSAVVTGALTQDERNRLSALIGRELGIPEKAIRWEYAD